RISHLPGHCPPRTAILVLRSLALLALACLRTTFGVALVWIFNVWGSADLLFAFYRGNQVGLEPDQLGAGFFIVTVLVPVAPHPRVGQCCRCHALRSGASVRSAAGSPHCWRRELASAYP